MNTVNRKRELTVVALGGNALGKYAALGESPALRVAACALARRNDRRFVLTHGNGPQIGQLAQCDIEGREPGLDVLGAETEGLLGYLVEQELGNQFEAGHRLATVLTRVEVAPDDPAFKQPDKPVGNWLAEAQKQALAAEHDWTFSRQGNRYRRLVPSPRPVRILQQAVINSLVEDNVTVICAGGGGIPVIRNKAGKVEGVEAVIDKDLSSALLAIELQADLLVLATDVDGVYRHWQEPDQEKLRTLSVAAAAGLELPAGSMKPKVLAACQFVEATGNPAVIGALAELSALLDLQAGTRVQQ